MGSNLIRRAKIEYAPVLFVESILEDEIKEQIEQVQKIFHPNEPIKFVDGTNGHAQRVTVLNNMANLMVMYFVWDDQSCVDGLLVLHCREEDYGPVMALRLKMEDAISSAWREHVGLCTFDQLVESGKGVNAYDIKINEDWKKGIPGPGYYMPGTI
ncbi:hypothetical protein BGX21_008453 [Mortierella sp. AD011]|nr:hypothetical protein BGX21_008453 [Mortierella sp. AD011]